VPTDITFDYEALAVLKDDPDGLMALVKLSMGAARKPGVVHDRGHRYAITCGQFINSLAGYATVLGCSRDKTRAILERLARLGILVLETVWPSGGKHTSPATARTQVTLVTTRFSEGQAHNEPTGERTPNKKESKPPPPPPTAAEPAGRVVHLRQAVPLPEKFEPTDAFRQRWAREVPNMSLDLFAAAKLEKMRARGETEVADLERRLLFWGKTEFDKDLYSHDPATRESLHPAGRVQRGPARAGKGRSSYTEASERDAARSLGFDDDHGEPAGQPRGFLVRVGPGNAGDPGVAAGSSGAPSVLRVEQAGRL
jgi:hypothetical protein